jgi:ABC-2 type transport system permease protein
MMGGALRAEWTKLRTMPGAGWALLALIGLTVGLGVLVTATTEPSTGCGAAACAQDPALLCLTGVTLGQLGAVLLGVLVMSTEYDSMMIRSTLASQPRRGMVLVAKAVVMTAAVLAAGAVGVLVSLLAGRSLLAGNGFTAAAGHPVLSLTDGSTLRAGLGTVLYLALIGLLSLGGATVLREAAPAVTTVMAVLYLPVILALVVPMSPQVHKLIGRYAPMSAGLAVRATVKLADSVPIGPWGGLGVLAAYSCLSMLAGYAMLTVRDT